MAKKSLLSKLGAPPTDDSLGAISWMQRALAAMAGEVLESNLTGAEKRDEMLKIADRMSRLRDPDRIYQAEQALRGSTKKLAETKPGPQLKDAPNLNSPANPVTARRGRPPRSALR